MPLPFPFSFYERMKARIVYNLMNIFSGSIKDKTGYINKALPINGYIENQNSPELSCIKYGDQPFHMNGCAVIAIYNCMYYITGSSPSIYSIIKALENKGIVLKGRFGTSPVAVADILLSLVISNADNTTDMTRLNTIKIADNNTAKTKLYTIKNADSTIAITKLYGIKNENRLKETICKLESSCSSYILLSILDRKDIKKGLHYMAITKEKSGFAIHNTGYRSPVQTDTLLEAITHPIPGSSTPVCIISCW